MKTILLMLGLSLITSFGQDLPVTFSVKMPPKAPATMVTITNGIVDPTLGPLLFVEVTKATTFSLAPFASNAVTTLKYRNLKGAAMRWPTNIHWVNWSSGPTNQVRGWVYFEETKGEIWAEFVGN